MLGGIEVGLITIFLGLYGLTNNRNAVKMLMSLTVVNTGVILLFISIAYKPGGSVPIIREGTNMVDPLPHTFMLTSIVVNLATLALGLALVLYLYREYETLDVRAMWEGSDD
ncbi:MAG: cation:proton antiporter subunit C [Candidatus Thermoplasmatota archaeon]|nr:cation:proton antiporter subunit C [Candidatus Thermoplasmatota archaeon]MBS3790621.1 cation:proton antiporter subunit C [Candidatus Thermoplasmatota archaeon]